MKRRKLKKIPLHDLGHMLTDAELEVIEKRIYEEYKQAAIEANKTLYEYLKAFEQKDKGWREMLARGDVTDDQYKAWRIGQIMTGQRWEAMRDKLADELYNTNILAKQIVYDAMPDIYKLNHDYATYTIERDSLVDTSYTLYNRDAAAYILREDPQLLPSPRSGGKVAQAIAEGEIKKWKNGQINSAVLQGILQGNTIPDLARRIRLVSNSDYKQSIRYARTMTTGVQNKARLDAGERARSMGIDIEYQWNATLDMRTRHSHRQLDGERKKHAKDKFSNGCRYPGDRSARGEEFWNCRCCMTEEVVGIDREKVTTSPKLGDMTYEEWKNSHIELTKAEQDQWIKDGKPNLKEWVKGSSYKQIHNSVADAKQYAKYKDILGDNAPKSLEKFKDIKYNNSDDWQLFKAYTRQIHSGELTPLADFKLYKKTSNLIDSELVGITTTNGVTITGKSKHFIARVIGSVEQRRNGVEIADIKYISAESKDISEKIEAANGGSQRIFGKGIVVSVNPDTGSLIQTNQKRTRGKK